MIFEHFFQSIKIRACLLIIGVCLGNVSNATDNFFKYNEASTDTSMLDIDYDSSLSVLKGLNIEDGVFQIRATQVQLVDSSGVAKLPDLPDPFHALTSAFEDDVLYVIGKEGFVKLALNDGLLEWSACEMVATQLGQQPALVAIGKKLFLSGAGENGLETFVYDCIHDNWQARAMAPQSLNGYIGAACGNDHLLYFNSTSEASAIFGYYQITDSWSIIGELPRPFQVRAVGAQGTQFNLYNSNVVLSGEAILIPTKYGWVDHLVVALLIFLMIAVGIYYSKKEKSNSDYFRGGKRIPWWAAGLSLFATGASAISLMAMPGKAYAENWIYMSISFFVVIIQIPLLLLVYIPVARRLNISTANEYLERRFGLPVRMLGFVGFSLNQILARMASILLLPALAISAIFGMPMEYSILIMGVATTIFVTMGGLEAVIWTDVLQAIIMLVAVILCSIYAFVALEFDSFAAADVLNNLDKLKMFDFSFNWQGPVVLVLALNTLVSCLGIISDQNFIQRVQCTQDEKESRKAVYTQLAIAVPMNLVLFTLGTLLFLFYVTRSESLSPALKPDSIFPYFAAQNLPTGMAGFVVVALLAATMSTVSSAMNSVANLGVEDVYRRFAKGATDAKCLKVGRYLTFFLGVFGTAAALALASMNSLQSIWDLFLMITGMILAPITGIFVLGIFTTRTNNTGIFFGTMASILANYYAKFHMEVHALVYLVIGLFFCVIVGYFASYLKPSSTRDLEGLTVYSLLKRRD